MKCFESFKKGQLVGKGSATFVVLQISTVA